MASIRIEKATKIYPNGHVAVRDLDLEIADGELAVFVGPSGCGKSTALRMIAGLETPTEGRLYIGDRDVTELPPQNRNVAMVFQSYALYPHMTVRENLAFGLRMRRTEPSAIEEKVAGAAAVLGLEPLLERKPSQLSGGQRQRVALGRAIVRDPDVFLFDEPLSNLDAKLRVQTRAELARMHHRFGATMVYVTHDQEEAMTLGQRIIVLEDGQIQQVAPPMETYRAPANVFVAGFVGSPAMNFLAGRIVSEQGRRRIAFGGLEIPLAKGGSTERERGALAPGREVILGIRPQDVVVRREFHEETTVEATIDVAEPLGSHVLLHLALEGTAESDQAFRALVSADMHPLVGESVSLLFPADRLHLFDAASEERIN